MSNDEAPKAPHFVPVSEGQIQLWFNILLQAMQTNPVKGEKCMDDNYIEVNAKEVVEMADRLSIEAQKRIGRIPNASNKIQTVVTPNGFR